MSGRLEKEIEAKVVKWWEAKGRLQVKMNLLGQKGFPDRLFFLHFGLVVLVEFKRPGEKPYPIQQYRMKKLMEFGHLVIVTDNVEDASTRLEQAFLASAKLSEGSS